MERRINQDTRTKAAIMLAKICEEVEIAEREIETKKRDLERKRLIKEKLTKLVRGECTHEQVLNEPLEGTKQAALLQKMRERPDHLWNLKEVISVLGGKTSVRAEKVRVRKLIYDLIERGVVKKISRGRYQVEPALELLLFAETEDTR